MGYRSDIVIAVRAEVLTLHLVSPIIPAVLLQCEHTDANGVRYWKLTGWKWYEEFPEVQDILAFFKVMDELQSDSLYAAARAGEDHTDTEEWGDPDAFYLWFNTTINCPV